MHNKSYKMMEKLCEEMEAVGLDNMDMEQLEKAKAFSCIASNMAQTEYHKKILDEMENPDNEYGKDYDENGPLRQFSESMHPRSSTGRFVRRYEEPMHDKMPMEVYYGGERYYTAQDGGMTHADGPRMQEMIENDRMNYPVVSYRDGNRHYSEGGSNGSSNMNYSSEYDRRRRTYMDKKKMGENATKQMDEAMDSLKDSVMAMTKNASPDERMIARQKIMKLAESIPQ